MIMGNLCRQTSLRSPFYYKAKGFYDLSHMNWHMAGRCFIHLSERPLGLECLCLHCILCANIWIKFGFWSHGTSLACKILQAAKVHLGTWSKNLCWMLNLCCLHYRILSTKSSFLKHSGENALVFINEIPTLKIHNVYWDENCQVKLSYNVK